MKFKGQLDYAILIVVVALLGVGITMSYSASAVFAAERYGDPYFFLKKTLVFAGAGFVMLIFGLRFPYSYYKKIIYPFFFITTMFTVAVFIPGVGRTIGGATRWVNLGPVNFQPSEALKIAVILFLAYSLEKKKERLGEFGLGFAFHGVIIASVATLVIAQRDFGSAMIIVLVGLVMMLASGMKIRFLMFSLVGLIPAAIWLVMGSGYRLRRIAAFLDPWQDRYGSGFQVIQSLVAFNQGGWFGKGLGQGQQKLFYLPESHTDFIFSVVGEEMGIAGATVVIALFAIFCYRGLKIAMTTRDAFGSYLAIGFTSLICLEAVLNMGVVMGLLPPKGMVLPFVSYGGSSLVMSLFAVGILLSISAGRSGGES